MQLRRPLSVSFLSTWVNGRKYVIRRQANESYPCVDSLCHWVQVSFAGAGGVGGLAMTQRKCTAAASEHTRSGSVLAVYGMLVFPEGVLSSQ